MTPFRFPLALLALLLALTEVSPAQSPSLEESFRNPPLKARPYVWWHWMGSNFSKEGITRDLEAMKACGIGGATIFNLASAVQESHKPTLNNPWPDQTYRSPKYWEALKHAAAEAQRLGLEIGLHNTVGYSTTGGPWIDEEKNMQKVVSRSVMVEGGKKVTVEIPRPEPTTYKGWGSTGQTFSFLKDIAVLAVPADGDVDPAKVIDLSKSFKADKLDWDAPAGKWQVVRLCHAPTGASPHPVPDELIGKTLEADKMSLEASRYHWDQVIEPMKQHLGPYLGKSFHHFLIDSYEAGPQNWTPAFREEFQKRKGYDPLPWLLTLEKRTVGNADLSARFKWDYDDVIRALYYDNGWLTGVARMKAVGVDLQFEPYGGPFDTVEGAALADIPMGEFWTKGGGGINSTVVSAARAAGRTVVGAEAFTGPPDLSKWTETPAFLKRSADGTYASGANRLVLHHWVHQPFDDRYKPGMGMGWWGTHFSRHQTWAKDGTAFFQYLGRCQAMLQAGETPSDFVSVGKSQGGDIVSWRTFRNGVSVRDGRIVLPSGRSYPFLGIPHEGRLLPEDVRKIAELLQQGATLVCSKPSGSLGLAGYPKSDAEIRSSTLWNDEPVRKIGKGTLFTKGEVSAAIATMGITPRVQISGSSAVVFTPRKVGETDLTFLANTRDEPACFTSSFRVTGKRPELWDAETGSIRFAPVWREKDGRIEVDLTLEGGSTVFVVFRDSKLPADHVVSVDVKGADESKLEIVKARFGTPEGNRWMDVTPKLQELAAKGKLSIPSVEPRVFGRDPASNIVKRLEVDYKLGGISKSVTVSEKEALSLGSESHASPIELQAALDGSVTATSNAPATIELVFASGKHQPISLAKPSGPKTVEGPWQVVLDSPVDQKKTLTLASLGDLTGQADPAVRYFSGTATYSTQIEIESPSPSMVLDLGKVCDLARVTVNGRDLGVVWRSPFTLEIGPALKAGRNDITIDVTNTWHNCLVGDEQLPADFEWGEDRGEKGHAMKAYPDWFIRNQPRPERDRKCFVVWYYHRKDTKLQPAGLIGPVRLISRTSSSGN